LNEEYTLLMAGGPATKDQIGFHYDNKFDTECGVDVRNALCAQKVSGACQVKKSGNNVRPAGILVLTIIGLIFGFKMI